MNFNPALTLDGFTLANFVSGVFVGVTVCVIIINSISEFVIGMLKKNQNLSKNSSKNSSKKFDKKLVGGFLLLDLIITELKSHMNC